MLLGFLCCRLLLSNHYVVFEMLSRLDLYPLDAPEKAQDSS